MKEWLIFFLPPAVALTGMRLVRILGVAEAGAGAGFGLRFAAGLGVGMLVFTQLLLASVLLGLNTGRWLGIIALGWGLVELILLAWPALKRIKCFRFQRAQWWWLLLLPLVWYFWLFGRLALLEGTIEFDAAVHWLMKSKIMFYKQGHDFLLLMHDPSLAYIHWDYPLLVPALYTLNYNLLGSVNEFMNKVWPIWMMASLCLAVLSLGNVWRRPHPLPAGVALILCFLSATLYFVHMEGGTAPMVFYAGLGTLLIVRALAQKDESTLAGAVLILAGCAMTKFEGILYAGFWLCALLVIGQRRKLWGSPILRKAAILAVFCLLPYVAFRLNKPVLHPESHWPKTALHSPGTVLHNFPRVLTIGFSARFFNDEFFTWTETDDGGLQWTGKWIGFKSFLNGQLVFLPWMILFLFGFALWQGRHRRLILLLTGVIFSVLAFVALVIACLPQLTSGSLSDIFSKTGEDMARYYYPFFMAWFLGLVSLWFRDDLRAPSSDSHV